MKADLDACLAAGMNDYVTKPIDRTALIAALRRWLPRRSPEAPAVSTPDPQLEAPAGPELEGVDVTGTLQRLGIDRSTLERMLLRSVDGQRELLEAARAAACAGDSAMAAKHAHAIAGAAGNLGADGLHSAAKALERAARAGRTDLTDLLAAVERQAIVVFRSIEALRPSANRESGSANDAFDPVAAGGALERLVAALERYDLSAATDALAGLCASGLPEWATEDLQRLGGHVDGYEYDEAREVASRLLASVQRASVPRAAV
jgi:two-component system sensor histidine kinase/response regulator